MKLFFRTLLVALAAIAITSTAFGQDYPGSKDYPGITRMPGMEITEYHDFQFDSAKFTVTQNGKQTDQTIEGRKVVIHYGTIRGWAQISTLQIIRNLQNAVRTAGGQVIDDSEGTNWHDTTLRFTKGGKEVWVRIDSWINGYAQTVVEREGELAAGEIFVDGKPAAGRGSNADKAREPALDQRDQVNVERVQRVGQGPAGVHPLPVVRQPDDLYREPALERAGDDAPRRDARHLVFSGRAPVDDRQHSRIRHRLRLYNRPRA